MVNGLSGFIIDRNIKGASTYKFKKIILKSSFIRYFHKMKGAVTSDWKGALKPEFKK